MFLHWSDVEKMASTYYTAWAYWAKGASQAGSAFIDGVNHPERYLTRLPDDPGVEKEPETFLGRRGDMAQVSLDDPDLAA